MPLLNPATLKSEDLSITVSEEVQGNRGILVPQTCALPSNYGNVPLAQISKYHETCFIKLVVGFFFFTPKQKKLSEFTLLLFPETIKRLSKCLCVTVVPTPITIAGEPCTMYSQTAALNIGQINSPLPRCIVMTTPVQTDKGDAGPVITHLLQEQQDVN